VSSGAGYLLKAFPDWIEHDDEPNVTAEVVSYILLSDALNVIDPGETVPRTVQLPNCGSKLILAAALPRMSGTATTISWPTTAADEATGRSLTFWSKIELIVCLTKTRPALLM
jgi:hypothetical protein